MAQNQVPQQQTANNQPLPFFYFKDGVLQLCAHDGLSMLPDDWEGLICGKGVTDLWYLGFDGGERSFNKLQAKTQDAAVTEIQALLLAAA